MKFLVGDYNQSPVFYFEEIAEHLRRLLSRLSDRLLEGDQREVAELIEANEPGVALEWMSDALSEGEQPLTKSEREDMLAVARHMGLGDRVSDALAFCPE